MTAMLAPSAGPPAGWNEAITARLREAARLLGELVTRGGPEALRGRPGIGPGIAAAIHEILATGRWGLLERLRARSTPSSSSARSPASVECWPAGSTTSSRSTASRRSRARRTIVTETQGPLAGRRVVRGRESECHAEEAATSDCGERRSRAGPGSAASRSVSPGRNRSHGQSGTRHRPPRTWSFSG